MMEGLAHSGFVAIVSDMLPFVATKTPGHKGSRSLKLKYVYNHMPFLVSL